MPSAFTVPGPPLADFVELIWIYEGYAVPHAQERLMPTGTMDLVISLDQDNRSGSGLSGARSEFAVLDTSLPFSIIGVRFKPGGGFPFFPFPAGEFQNLGATLEDVWGGGAALVREQLLEAVTADARLRILERTLRERLIDRRPRHRAVRLALKMFERVPYAQSIGAVIAQVGLSERRFSEVFRNEVGLTPKLYSRVRRFQRVLGSLETSVDIDWANVSLSCGYFDQAHFIHDFRAFAGMTPSAYVRGRTARNHVRVHD